MLQEQKAQGAYALFRLKPQCDRACTRAFGKADADGGPGQSAADVIAQSAISLDLSADSCTSTLPLGH